MFKTLYGKLVIALLALLSILGIVYVALTLITTRLFLEEVNQKLNQSLAGNLVNEALLMQDRHINNEALKQIFHNLMVINPSIEVYLIDPAGKILAYSAPPGKVKRESVSLDPIKRFIADRSEYPLAGDDPRDGGRTKVFSAAPIVNNGTLEGYLYVVLGGEAYDSVAQMLQGSYVLRLSAGASAAGLLLTLAGGVLLFNLLTRRLRRLTESMEAFKQGDFQQPADLPPRAGRPRDEIDQLNLTFAQMAERIMHQIHQLQHADASRRELVANVSHDLRTPLASLQGYLETLLLKQDILSNDERRHYLDIAVKHSQRLGTLISELFELAMLDTQGTSLHFEPFSMAELLHDVAQKFKLEAERKNIHIETRITAEAPFVSADIALIERVLENLIENAIKYTEEGGTIAVGLGHIGQQVVTCISDTGQGIPEQDLPQIFDRFYRVEKHRKTSSEGTGLGLAITQRILQLHNTVINVDSTLNKGTTFTFPLPVVDG